MVAAPPVVLVVEHQRALLDVLLEALSWEGYEVVPATGGAEAATVLRSRTVDLLVADPPADGAGSATISELVGEFPDLPIVEFGGEAPAGLFLDRWITAGNRITLRRPFRLADLLAACREAVAPPRDEDAAPDAADEADGA